MLPFRSKRIIIQRFRPDAHTRSKSSTRKSARPRSSTPAVKNPAQTAPCRAKEGGEGGDWGEMTLTPPRPGKRKSESSSGSKQERGHRHRELLQDRHQVLRRSRLDQVGVAVKVGSGKERIQAGQPSRGRDLRAAAQHDGQERDGAAAQCSIFPGISTGDNQGPQSPNNQNWDLSHIQSSESIDRYASKPWISMDNHTD